MAITAGAQKLTVIVDRESSEDQSEDDSETSDSDDESFEAPGPESFGQLDVEDIILMVRGDDSDDQYAYDAFDDAYGYGYDDDDDYY